MSVVVTIAIQPADRAACDALRKAVFVVEQGVPAALEWDDKDAAATHFLARDDGHPVGTARLFDDEGLARIGRVAVLAEARGRSVGRLLMLAALDQARREGFPPAVLDAQVHALPFYERLGFAAHGPEFDDAGIPHRRRRLELEAPTERPKRSS